VPDGFRTFNVATAVETVSPTPGGRPTFTVVAGPSVNLIDQKEKRHAVIAHMGISQDSFDVDHGFAGDLLPVCEASQPDMRVKPLQHGAAMVTGCLPFREALAEFLPRRLAFEKRRVPRTHTPRIPPSQPRRHGVQRVTHSDTLFTMLPVIALTCCRDAPHRLLTEPARAS
jgi:hypothetical protein